MVVVLSTPHWSFRGLWIFTNKMIHKGAVVGILVFDEPIRKQRLDAFQLYFEKAMLVLPT